MPNTTADPTAFETEEEVADMVSPISDQITTNPQRLGGQPVFRGTRVPVDTLFDHLARGYTIEYVAAQFGTVSMQQLEIVLEDIKRTYNEPATALAAEHRRKIEGAGRTESARNGRRSLHATRATEAKPASKVTA